MPLLIVAALWLLRRYGAVGVIAATYGLVKLYRYLTLVKRYEDLVNDIKRKIKIFSSDPIKSRWFSLKTAITGFDNFLKGEISSKDLEIANAILLSRNDLILRQLRALYDKIKEEKGELYGKQINRYDSFEKMEKYEAEAPFTLTFDRKPNPNPYSNNPSSKEDLGYVLKILNNQKSEVLRIIRKAENVFKELERVKEIHKDEIEGFESEKWETE